MSHSFWHGGFIGRGWSFTLPTNEAGIRNELGSPSKIERRKVENKSTKGQMDEIVGLQYKGLLVGLYKTSGTEQFIEVLVNDSQYPIRFGLGVGTTADGITQVLGKADETTANTLMYSTSQSGYETEPFKMADGRVPSIEWVKQIE